MADPIAYGITPEEAKALRSVLGRYLKTPTRDLQQAARDAVVDVAVKAVGAEHLADKIAAWLSEDEPAAAEEQLELGGGS